MPAGDSLEELKKKFIVDEEAYEAQRLKADLERLLQYCRISSQGRVLVTAKELPDRSKVGLVITARYVASKLDANIADIVSADEISSYTGIEKGTVRKRAQELVDEGFAARPEPGNYRAKPGRIQDFLDQLEKKRAR